MIIVAIAGGAGAAARYLVDSASSSGSWPRGTVTVNLIGSFLLGIFTGLALTNTISPHWLAVLGAGFCGGFTTFSTASLDVVELGKESPGKALALAGAQLVSAIALTTLGLWITQ